MVNSLYYTEEQCNNKFSRDKISNQQFSIIHFYCRSLSSNYNNLKDSITALELKFDVIALSESWLSENDSDLYHIDDYNMFSNHRVNKKGGGVVLSINNFLQHKYLPNKSISIENCAEIVSVEVTLRNGSKVTVCCIYRAPNTDLELLGDCLSIFRNNRNKLVYLCGDFNIDLLQYEKHKDTTNFIEQLYSLGLHPLIARPTKVTSHSTNLIDNIFTTDVVHEIQSGLLINDMSDHLPIFQITEYAEKNKNELFYSKKRVVNEKAIDAIRHDLLNTDWNLIEDSEDVNLMYNTFMYYTDILEINKGNVKETWKIINSIINKKKGNKY